MPTPLLDRLVPATEFSKNPAPFIERASDGEQIIILKNSRPAAVIIDVATSRRLENLDTLEDDLRLLAVTLVRAATDNGRRYELADVIAELGIDVTLDEGEGE